MTVRPAALFSTGCLLSESSGPYLSLKQTVGALARGGYSTSVVGTKPRRCSEPSDWDGEIRAFNRYGPDSLHYAPALSAWLHAQPLRWDVASMQGVWLWPNHVVANWCLKNARPFMITAHGNFNAAALRISSWKKLVARHTFLRNVLSEVTCYQALTEVEYKTMRKIGITAPICVIGNGIEIPHGAIDAPEEILASDLTPRRTCLYLGRIAPIKGLERLLYAWARARPGDEWQLVVAGGGEEAYVSQLKAYSKSVKCRNLHFIGPVYGKQKLAWLRQAEFMALTSYSEAFPMTVLEAFAVGTPVLMTAECGLPDAAASGGAIEVGPEAEEIISGLNYLLSMSGNDLRGMGGLGCSLVQDRFTWDRIGRELTDMYNWMKGGDAPDCLRFD